MTPSTRVGGERPSARLRVGVLGCGAIVEQQRLPDARDVEEIEIRALVDTDIERARDLADRFGIAVASDDIGVLVDHTDAVLIALPHHLHAEYAVRLSELGLHLMIEKPLAVTTDDCDRVMAAARRNGVVLGLAMDRLFLPQFVAAGEIIASDQLGTITGIEIVESSARRWPSVAGFYFDPARAGGGVLLNNAIHTLDLLLRWFGDPVAVDYADDHLGGLETECKLALEFEGGVTASLAFSRLRKMADTTIIRGANGTIEVDAYEPCLRRHGAVAASVLPAPDPGAMWRDWARAIRNGGRPAASADDGRRAIALIERCYRDRRRLALPWVFPGPAPETCDGLAGRTILVTGGSGFIGGRVVEMARLFHDARVRVLTREAHRARRAARLDVEIVEGDIAEPAVVHAAAAGCDIIVHCAFGDGSRAEQRAGTVDGTYNVVNAAMAAGVSRVVHVSTVMVYGTPDVVILDETSPRRPGQSFYAETKAEAEDIIWRAHKQFKLPVVVLQPTIVYGPYGGYWTTRQIERFEQYQLALPVGEEGCCNIVYVDDMARAVLLAATNEAAVGHAFLVTGPDRVTWRQYYDAFGRLHGRAATFDLSMPGIRMLQYVQEHRWLRLPLRAASRLSPHVPDINRFDMPTDAQILQLRSRMQVSTEKARKILGFEPVFDFERGMALTSEWAMAAGLAGDDPR
jgi:predicted dehydrogenase/nucleoside-diphosphate-sugar epimerase